jgi:hypothetical protein
MGRWATAALVLLGWLGITQAQAVEKPVLFAEQPVVLGALEDRGYDFPSLFGVTGRSDLASLYEKSPAYGALVDLINADVAELRGDIKSGGRSLHEFTAAETGRVMDMRWLKSSGARFRLVGVVNRLDRRDFHDMRGEAACGEVRLIYRLAYSFRKDGKGKLLSSRMPFNFNAVFDVPPDADGSCAARANAWQAADDQVIGAAWLTGGPLDRTSLRFRQLELNAQMVRFPSGQEPQFGGQAIYLMRIFGITGDSISELPLENTPDVARLSADAALKAELATYIRDNERAIDQGVYMIPDHLLARKVISYSTFGGARQVNHPFTPLYSPQDFAGLDFSGNRLVRSPEALLARLDNGTCQGCHQSGATAGFHFIGLDDKFTSPLNRIEVGISPHFHAELPRREAWLDAVVAGRDPNRFRPLSFAPPAAWKDETVAYEEADLAQPCLSGQDAARFGDTWQCGSGTVCTSLAAVDKTRVALAQCLPAPKAEMSSGLPCLQGEVTASSSQPFMDKYPLTQFAAFAAKASPFDYTCRPPRIGVPGGMAYRQCNENDRAFVSFKPGAPQPAEICGLTGGKKFDECVSTGNFDQCLAGAVQRGNRSSCSAEHFCRDDYICQAFPPDTPNVGKIKGVGFCSPTYFMFQMRIDNHTTPWKSRQRAVYRSVEADDGEDQW